MGTPSESDVRSVQGSYARRVLRSLPYRPSKPFRRVFPDAHPEAIDLMEHLLAFDSSRRLSADMALKHAYFDPVRSSTENIVMESPIDREFEFDRIVEPELAPMRKLIFEEIMRYHRKPRRRRGRSKSRSPKNAANNVSATTIGVKPQKKPPAESKTSPADKVSSMGGKGQVLSHNGRSRSASRKPR